MLTGTSVTDRRNLWSEYYEYLRGEWESVCAENGIPPPIHMHSITGHYDGSTTFRIGNDAPGQAMEVTYCRGALLEPPPL